MEHIKFRHLLAIGAAVGSLAAFSTIDSPEDKYEKAVEACVGDLVGHSVDLVQDPKNGGLQHPASVLSEQIACERNNNDPVAAANW